MQLQDVQAFVRLGSRTHYLVVTNAEQLRDVSPSLAILLPNCTSEVSLAVEDSMPPHGEVRDLRDEVSKDAVRIVRASIAPALDMPDDRALSEYTAAIRSLMQDYTEAKKRLAPENAVANQQAKFFKEENERLREQCHMLDTDVKRLEEECERLRENVKSLKWQNGQLSALNKKWADGLTDDARVAYNQGCADTVAAFRKAQGEG